MSLSESTQTFRHGLVPLPDTREPRSDVLLSSLTVLGEIIVEASTEQMLLGQVVQKLALALRAEYCAILEIISSDQLLLRAGVGWKPDLIGNTTTLIEPESRLAGLLKGRRPHPAISMNPDSWLNDIHLFRTLGCNSGLGVILPRRSRNEAYGVLTAHSLKAQYPDEKIKDFLRTAASMISAGIERLRNAQGIRLLRETAVAITAAPDFNTALQHAMDHIRGITGWDYCESWIPNADNTLLERGPCSYPMIPSLKKFSADTASMTFTPGEGLAGRLWLRRDPEWIIDISRAGQRYIRPDLAVRAGLHTALAISIVSEGEVLAVLVFYHYRRHRRSQRMIELITQAFRPIGALIKQKKLEAVRAKLAAIIDSTDDAILSTMLDGTVTSWNPSAERLYGYHRDEIIGQSIDRLVPPERSTETVKLLENIRQGQHVQHFETVRMNKQGERLYVSLTVSPIKDPSGRIIGVSSISQDVTRTKRIEREHARLAAIVEGSQDAILSMTLDGTIVSWNRGAERIYGFSSEEAVGNNHEIITPPDRLGELPWIIEMVRRGRDVTAFETIRCTKDGRRIDVALTVSPVRDEAGQITGAAAIARDITASRKMQRELVQARVQLEQRVLERTADLSRANTLLQEEIEQRAQVEAQSRKHLNELARVARLSTMGEMASGLAHELNQPLCAIVNYTEACLNLIRSGQSEPQAWSAALVQVARQAQRAGEVVRRLRDFIRRREPDESEQNINCIIQDVVGLSHSELSQHQTQVEVDLTPDLPPVYVDAIQIQQVILNLLRNALDAMKEVPAPQRRVYIRSRHVAPDEVEIQVSDQGCGISPDVMDHLFKPFYTTKSDGLGMGLSIGRSIIAAHRGRLWATPSEETGVTFHFTLPATGRNVSGE